MGCLSWDSGQRYLSRFIEAIKMQRWFEFIIISVLPWYGRKITTAVTPNRHDAHPNSRNECWNTQHAVVFFLLLINSRMCCCWHCLRRPPPSPFNICFCFFSFPILFSFFSVLLLERRYAFNALFVMCIWWCSCCRLHTIDSYEAMHLCVVYRIIALRWIMYVGQHPEPRHSHTLNLFAPVYEPLSSSHSCCHQPWRISFVSTTLYMFWFTLDRLVSALLFWIRSLECRRRRHNFKKKNQKYQVFESFHSST